MRATLRLRWGAEGGDWFYDICKIYDLSLSYLLSRCNCLRITRLLSRTCENFQIGFTRVSLDKRNEKKKRSCSPM